MQYLSITLRILVLRDAFIQKIGKSIFVWFSVRLLTSRFQRHKCQQSALEDNSKCQCCGELRKYVSEEWKHFEHFQRIIHVSTASIKYNEHLSSSYLVILGIPYRSTFLIKYLCINDFVGRGSSVGIATELRAGRSGIESRWGRDFPPVQTGPGGPTQPPGKWVPGLSRG